MLEGIVTVIVVQSIVNFFYDQLNAYENSKYSKNIEEIQVIDVENLLKVNISEAQVTYKIFEYYFDKYVSSF